MKGIAHITGGGFTDNIPRIFPEGLGSVIDTNAWPIPHLFKWIQEVRRIPTQFLVIDDIEEIEWMVGDSILDLILATIH